MKIAIQGEHGAYSESAARHIFGKKSAIIPMPDFNEVFMAVKNGKVHRGVVPMENSLAGSIHQNFDLLQRYNLKIVEETHLRIEHVLMGIESATLKSVKEVWSHPQALSQCSNYFSKRKSISAVAFYDTAGAAKHIAELASPNAGALASIHAAKIYKLKILKRNLENNHHNFTRFVGISTNPRALRSRGIIKSSISFAPKRNQSGILFKMLGVFALRNINLLKIESRPMQERAFEYIFYLDFEGSPADKHIARALEHLKEMSSMYRYFGTYPAGKWTYIE